MEERSGSGLIGDDRAVSILEARPRTEPGSGVYVARHPQWEGMLTLRKDGSFVGGGARPDGRWELTNEQLTIHWYHWPAETLSIAGSGVFDGDFRLEAITGVYMAKHPHWEGTVEILDGGEFLGGAAYPNGTWSFQDGWLKLHWYHWKDESLRYCGDRRFFGDFELNPVSLNAAPKISFIVPCMGRLAFLEQTLPSVISQSNCEYILVDYSCPDECGKWAERKYPQVKVVRKPGAEHFNLSWARNIGANLACSEWLCFLDCDVVLSQHFVARVRFLLGQRNFVAVAEYLPGLSGLLVCRRVDFFAVGGYDTRFTGWGGEDDDIKRSLLQMGLAHTVIESNIGTHIEHDDSMRTRNYKERDKGASQNRARAYLATKASPKREVLIPKVFHRVWLGSAPMPPELARFGDSWLEKHPGWRMRLWTDNDLIRLSLASKDPLVESERLTHMADVLHYEIIRHNGGVFLEIDFECIKNIEPLIYNIESFAAFEIDGRVSSAIFGAVSHHASIEYLLAAFSRGWPIASTSIGSELMTTSYINRNDVRLLESMIFYPCGFDETHPGLETFPNSYGVRRKYQNFK